MTNPRTAKDLMLAPVAIAIDANLRPLRSAPADAVPELLGLWLDRPASEDEYSERSELVLTAALRHVDMHGWQATIGEDHSSVHLSGGSETLDLALGVSATSYLDQASTASARGSAG